MKRLTKVLLLSQFLLGCGGSPSARLFAPPVSTGKYRAKSLSSPHSRFSKHHLLLRGESSALPTIPGMRVRQKFGDAHIVTLSASASLEQTIAELQQSAGVTRVEKVELFPLENAGAALPAEPPTLAVPQAPPLAAAANDTRYFEQWSHEVARIPQAWRITRGHPDVKVAVLDTGVDAQHPDLLGQVVDGPDLAESKASSQDIDSHGTHVAGIIAAKADNGIGVAGVAPDSRVLALKIFEPYYEDGRFQGVYYNAVSLARAVHYAATLGGAKIINISAGIADDPLVSSMLSFARGKGVIICVSAGNKGSNVYTGQPKYLDGVLAVHATDPMDRLARFSNFGNTLGISAPGMMILSTVPTYANPLTGAPPRGNGYERLNGTSMASPFVAGVAALAVAAVMDAVQTHALATTGRPTEVKPEQIPAPLIEDLIRLGAVDLGVPGRDEVYGAGRVDAARVVELARTASWVERAWRSLRR
ncbi:MAG: S8 family serine peptidase [Candidatus Sericytochromatia bacterium]|nr:S8 family serine peptidase [Candidatus Sericytochromatia bacterium]